MASTKADGNRVGWRYVSDIPQNFAVSAKAVYVLDGTDGAKYGGQAAGATDVAKPTKMRMRAVKCTSAGLKSLYITVYDTSCDLWTTPGTTVVRNINGVDATYTSTATRRGEKYRDTVRETA